MKEYTTEKIRNVALVGHQGCGKTSLVEALLYNSGATTRLGRIEEGSTASDWEDDEKQRQISLSTSLIPIEFSDHKINVLDAPGYTDFQGDVRNAIRVADSVIVVIDAVAGVEVGTELAWEYAKQFLQPIIVVINKLDRENANFQRTLQGLRDTFPDHKFVPVMLPIGEQADFKGIVNVLTMKAYYEAGKDRSDLPADMVETAEAARRELIEAAAEADDAYIEKYFTEGVLTDDEIRDGMRKAARNHALNTVPVFVTSATKNIGTYPVLESFVAYTSSPAIRRFGVHRNGGAEIEYINGPHSDDAALAAYVFKTVNDRFVGTLSYMRVFAGHIKSDSRNWNNTRNIDERFGPIITLRGKEQISVPILHAGDIGVVAKLQTTQTGDTLGDRDKTFEIVKPNFSDPLYAVALQPKTQADAAKIGTVLTTLAQADPTLRWRNDGDTSQIILEGMGEIHVMVALGRADKLGVGILTEMPKVPYKETVTKKADASYRHKKQSGGAGQFGEITLFVEPNPGGGFVYEAKVSGGAVTEQFLDSAHKGILQVIPTGVIAGYPVVDVHVRVYDGKMHPVDSKDIAFQIAGRESFKEAFKEAGPVLLEPIMDVKITVPETMMGDIMSDLNTRRGRVQGMDTTGGGKSIVSAQVPLAEMLRYGNDLRSMSGGRGIYSMSFAHYERVPSNIAEPIVKSYSPHSAAE
ncbi:MAG: elongation factor G [Chloroflexi bacterium]|nr:elongation factor G [Chloroflexota bacterium]